jgi:hypothetical protein
MEVPFPIPPRENRPIIPEPTPFLFCLVFRAHLFSDGLGQDLPNGSCQGITSCLRDMQGNRVGVLFEQDRHSSGLISTSNRRSQKIELVEISRTICTQPDKEYDWERRYGKLPTDVPYDYYNVLWIWREMGAAYRRGLGRVLKEEWERLREKEAIDLILG